MADTRTSVHGRNSAFGEVDGPASAAFVRLLRIMRRLRDSQTGCPWDIAQTFRSITPYTIEEAYEVADAIERDAFNELPDELGDLLLQVVFLAQIGADEQRFGIVEVIEAISEKMERRHPHIFGEVEAKDAAAVKTNWETIKADEKRDAGRRVSSRLDDVPAGMPSLVRAQKLQSRAAKVGFDWPDADGAIEKLREETEELADVRHDDAERLEDELGDVLFTAVNVARKLGLDADAALRRANAKFERRFREVERSADTPLDGLSLEAMERLWQAAKRGEQHSGR